jgi:hypothetical protein
MDLKQKRNMIRNIAIIAFIQLLIAGPSYACSACFYGDPSQKTLIAAKWGVLSLLIILLGVMAGFIAFFINFIKRSSLKKAA